MTNCVALPSTCSCKSWLLPMSRNTALFQHKPHDKLVKHMGLARFLLRALRPDKQRLVGRLVQVSKLTFTKVFPTFSSDGLGRKS